MSVSPRSPRNFLTTLVVVVLARVAEPFIVRNVEYAIDKRDLDKLLDAVLVAVPDWIGPAIEWLNLGGFWGGAFSVLAVWGCLELVYAVQQRRRKATPHPTYSPSGGQPRYSAGMPFNIVEDGFRAVFDYSTHNGRIHVGKGDQMFVLRFTKASDTLIHFTKQGTNLEWIARAKGVQAGDAVDMERVERSSDNYTLGLAKFFLARNLAGRVLQGRTESIADELRGADRDEVVFSYRIMGDLPSTPETALIAALV